MLEHHSGQPAAALLQLNRAGLAWSRGAEEGWEGALRLALAGFEAERCNGRGAGQAPQPTFAEPSRS
jgi:hypothetical protein